MHKELRIHTEKQGLIEITDLVSEALDDCNIESGICVLFIQHTSASLIIQENADPSAKKDLEYWLNKLVKENDIGFTHVSEGADDMPSHIKAMLTNVSLSIPIVNGRLVLGTWQGVYLWEHRKQSHLRKIIVQIVSS